MVKQIQLAKTSPIVIAVCLLIAQSSAACDESSFSAIFFARKLQYAVLNEDFIEMAELAGGQDGPGAPHPDFILGGVNSPEGSVPFKTFLDRPVTILINEVYRNGQHFVTIGFVNSEALSEDLRLVNFLDLQRLMPYRDYYLCELIVNGAKPRMQDFCFAESGALLGDY